MKEKGIKRAVFTVSNLVVALICFVVFLVAGIGSYYMTVGEFVTAQLWVLYIALAAVGAVTMFLHWYWFAGLYYVGCVLGWASGRFIGGLKGEFAPTAGLTVTFALIAVFAILGAILQWKSLKKRHDRRKEGKAQGKVQAKSQTEADKLAAELEEARKEKEAAEAALTAAVAEAPVPGEKTPLLGASSAGEYKVPNGKIILVDEFKTE